MTRRGPGLYILNDAGNPVATDDVLVWGRFMSRAKRAVAQEMIGDVRVSTVFLGLDHQYGDGPPILWETMVFWPDEGGDECRRYSSLADAKAGHEAVVARIEGVVEAGLGLDEAPLKPK
jgi:hypothetical protein